MAEVPVRECQCDPTFPTLAPCLPTLCSIYHWAQLGVHGFLFVVVLLQVRTIHRQMKASAKAGKAGADSMVKLYEVMHILFLVGALCRWVRPLAIILGLDLPTTFYDFTYACGFTCLAVCYSTLGVLWYLTWLELDRVMGADVKPIEPLERRRKILIIFQSVVGGAMIVQACFGYTMYSFDHTSELWYLYVSRLSPAIVAVYALTFVIPTLIQARRIRKVVAKYQQDHQNSGFNYAKLTAAIYIALVAGFLTIITAIVSSLVLRTGTDQDFLMRNVTFRIAEGLVGFLILSYFARPPQSLRNLTRKSSGSRIKDLSKSALKPNAVGLAPRTDASTVLKLEPDTAVPEVPPEAAELPAAASDPAMPPGAGALPGETVADDAAPVSKSPARRRSSSSGGSGKRRRSSTGAGPGEVPTTDESALLNA